MLFRKDIEHRCAYCAHAARLDGITLICRRRGIVDAAENCHRFSYDPLKRIPPRPKAPDFSQYDDRDFSL